MRGPVRARRPTRSRAHGDRCRGVRDPFEVTDTYYTAAWSAYEVGHFRTAVELCAEFVAGDYAATPLGVLSLSVLSRVALGEWDEALAEQARVRELLGDQATDAPSFASRRLRRRRRFACTRRQWRDGRCRRDSCRGRGLSYEAERPRKWPAPAADSHARAARRTSPPPVRHSCDAPRSPHLPAARARSALHADRRAGHLGRGRRCDRARSRRHAAPTQGSSRSSLHADRLEGPRAACAARRCRSTAVDPLDRAASRLPQKLDARWEVALTELSLGEALVLARAEGVCRTRSRASGGQADSADFASAPPIEMARALLDAIS